MSLDSRSPATSPPSAAPPLRVFVVEDHAETLKYLLLFLRQLGCETAYARSLAEAIAVLADHKPDVLISDVSLLDGDSWSLAQHVQAEHEVFCISMSGLETETQAQLSREAGFHYHLPKPFLPRELKSILYEIAERRRLCA